MYELLAKYYDQLVYDQSAIQAYSQFVQSFLNHCTKGVDFGCGSGDILLELAKEYTMVGVDLSQDMLDVLKSKNRAIETICANMVDVNLNQTFDFATCLCDSLNYLNSLSQIQQFFNHVYDCLNDQAIFIVDAHHINRLNEFKNEWIEEGSLDDCDYQWMIHSENDHIYQHFAFYTHQGLVQEYHDQTVYTKDELMQAMESAGFKNIQIYYDMQEVEDDQTEKIFLIGEKV